MHEQGGANRSPSLVRLSLQSSSYFVIRTGHSTRLNMNQNSKTDPPNFVPKCLIEAGCIWRKCTIKIASFVRHWNTVQCLVGMGWTLVSRRNSPVSLGPDTVRTKEAGKLGRLPLVYGARSEYSAYLPIETLLQIWECFPTSLWQSYAIHVIWLWQYYNSCIRVLAG